MLALIKLIQSLLKTLHSAGGAELRGSVALPEFSVSSSLDKVVSQRLQAVMGRRSPRPRIWPAPRWIAWWQMRSSR
jgi:hypothetical protein